MHGLEEKPDSESESEARGQLQEDATHAIVAHVSPARAGNGQGAI